LELHNDQRILRGWIYGKKSHVLKVNNASSRYKWKVVVNGAAWRKTGTSSDNYVDDGGKWIQSQKPTLFLSVVQTQMDDVRMACLRLGT
jgi:ribosomal protein L24